MSINFNPFKLPSISYGITVCNEVQELKIVLDILLKHKGKDDEIIVLQDITIDYPEMERLLSSYPSIIKIQGRLNGDFATFKNNLLTAASKNFLFQIDADEYPQPQFLKKIKWFLFKNYKADCILVPRINTVKNISQDDIQTWGWTKNDDGYINFPDFQTRIFKLNGKIKWVNKVHETLINFEKKKPLPIKNYDYCLIHNKDIIKQREQNEFYAKL